MTQPSVKKMLGQPLDAKEYPFPDTWSSSLQRDLVLAFCWTVEGLPFRPMKEDHENNWILERQETCTIDVPVVLVKMKQKQSNKQTSVAVALSIDPSQTIPVLMCVKCQVRILNMYFFPTFQRVHVFRKHITPRRAHARTHTHTHTHTHTLVLVHTHAHTNDVTCWLLPALLCSCLYSIQYLLTFVEFLCSSLALTLPATAPK